MTPDEVVVDGPLIRTHLFCAHHCHSIVAFRLASNDFHRIRDPHPARFSASTSTTGVDHAQRRRQLAEALWRVVIQDDSLTEQVGRRIGEAFAGLPDTAGPRDRVRAVLAETLPLDAERRVEAQCGIAFLARAPVDARIADYFRTGYTEGHRYLTEQLALAGVVGPERQAHLLFGLTDGLPLHALAGHHTPETALAVLDDHLRQVFA